MRLSFLRTLLGTFICLNIVFVDVVQASDGEQGGNAQSPAQVIVQIALTGIALKILSHFGLP